MSSNSNSQLCLIKPSSYKFASSVGSRWCTTASTEKAEEENVDEYHSIIKDSEQGKGKITFQHSIITVNHDFFRALWWGEMQYNVVEDFYFVAKWVM